MSTRPMECGYCGNDHPSAQPCEEGSDMSMYQVTYAFDCPCYGTVDIEADSAEAALEKAKALHKADELIDGWDPDPAVGCTNYRIVEIVNADDDEDRVDGEDLE